MKQLKILHLEDSVLDAELVREALKDGGLVCQVTLVENREDFEEALARRDIDLVLADYKLPSFDGFAALEFVREKYPVVPFILVSGALGEDLAVESLKAGAVDYILKTGLNRLAQSVKRAMKEKEEHALLLEAKEMVENLSKAIDHSSDIVMITNQLGNIEYVNPAIEKITGYKSSEIIGKNPSFLKSGQHDNSFYDNLWNTINRGQTWQGIIVNKRKDGSTYHEDTTISPIFSKENAITGFIAIKRDITRVFELEKQLQQAQKMEAIGTMAGGIAHDFNNILTAILGYGEMVNDELPEGSIVKEDMQKILDGGHRAAALVKQILTFSRQTEHEVQPLNPLYIIKEALKLLRATIPSTIEIRQDLDMAGGMIMADPTQIHQILMNLCTNASQAMRERGGILSVKLARVEIEPGNPKIAPGLYQLVEVGDTGHGIGKDIKDRIFEPFFSTKQRGEGTGLGLSVVHGIVKSCGGEITVESEIGAGAIFRVYLPTINEEESKISLTRQNLPRGHERIMVVDDEIELAEMTRRMLTSLGYQVKSYTDSVIALNSYRQSPDEFDLVITDMTMPRMTGAELATEILKINPAIPIILCTGFSESINEESAKFIGIRSYLNKPVIKQSLANIVREFLDGN